MALRLNPMGDFTALDVRTVPSRSLYTYSESTLTRH